MEGTLDWKPAAPLTRTAVQGGPVRVEPLDPGRHAADLFAAQAATPELWDYLPYGPFADEAEFTRWVEARAATIDPLFYAVVETRTGRALGMASYLRVVPADGVIEVGHIWFGPALQRTRQATEAIYLMTRHVFDDLGYRRFEWKCNAQNEPSRRAAIRFGFTYEGTFRQHMVVKGSNRDTAWYAMLDGEWPRVKAAFEAWLRPENFDGQGRQIRSLEAVRAGLATL